MHTTPTHAPARRDDRGQTTAEYALVVLLAGTLAVGLIIWARSTDAITGLFDRVLDRLSGDI